ncbi:heavy metal-associated isoprenylated plant protein 43-like [Diospyros lotus]|uniref:heavy metal-associated isoprenylated plant protein 43-like n=1 Tax=Diospyros lotus TaxID=55363 RepID=UPI0022564621|nr:heavy metal-associated isoprenylated plant protein 43-like [Diospyros lotus]
MVMVQRTVLKVDISCHKCKTKLLKAVAGLQGVDKIEVDEAKGTLTVTGDADPYEIIVRTKKAGKFADVVSIGPPPPPPKPQDDPKKPEQDKKPEQKKPDQKAQPQVQSLSQPQAQPYFHNPHSCPVCEGVHADRWDDPSPSCSIL